MKKVTEFREIPRNYRTVAEAYTTRRNKEKTGKVLYVYLAWRVDRWDNKERYMHEPPCMRSNGVGGGGYYSLAWEGAVMMPLQGSPQASRVGGVEV
jgi:hypothetical protein